MSTAVAKTHKRDVLIEIEKKIQLQWLKNSTFNANPPITNSTNNSKKEKFMITFPFPYQNGRLHLGHSFSLSKCEFAAGYQRLLGKEVLFPFAFHCTGMPIKACADKLKNEVSWFGENFEGYDDLQDNKEPTTTEATGGALTKGKHSKALAKASGEKYQFQIMQSMGVETSEIHKFADPTHWLYYFPPITTQDLKDMGCRIDWRRSFITTDVNPYYDSFIRWQFNKLKQKEKVQFGERYTIYSPRDGQACMDHDRSSGEGVGVQEYTGIKIKVLLSTLNKTAPEARPLVKDSPTGSKLSSEAFKAALQNRELYFVAATLRPETMYGQTNCFVGVDINYGVFHVSDKEAWVCTRRAANSMAWQGLFDLPKGDVKLLFEFKGWDLVGVPVKAPLSFYDLVYTLPMDGGTGVVTSVPSDSPDDYVTLMDLNKKFSYYQIQKEWVEPFLPPKSIIKTPNYGGLAAVEAVEKLGIKSQKDKALLAEAKDAVYKEGFYSGTLIVGEHAGKSVQEAKPLIRALLIASKDAFAYCEPDGVVVSRSGEECVVALMDQWYMNYGEEEWKRQALECLEKMDTFGREVRHAFEKNLDWLGQWACSRKFGLGSRLPWDPQWLIESLSDSTIYMAYYTVAHLLHEGSVDGSKPGPLSITPDQMTDAVWEYIMNPKAEFPSETTIKRESLDLMKNEFNYFYPLDLRCSGKDLVTNHLTFFLYNHVAIFEKENWPKAVRSNGHLLLEGGKMSKSNGTFVTLRDALDKYGADGMRFALADAGDSTEDANFIDKTANSAILRLYTEKEWFELNQTQIKANNFRRGKLNFFDKVFIEEMRLIVDLCKEQYDQMLFAKALKFGFFDFQNARNEYRKICTGEGLPGDLAKEVTFHGFHEEVIMKFMKVQTLLLSPITSHWSEYCWQTVLEQPGTIHEQLWPTFEEYEVDKVILEACLYLREFCAKVRSNEDAAERKRQKKGKKVVVGAHAGGGEKMMKVFVVVKFPEWQVKVIDVLKECFDMETKKFTGKETALLGSKGLLKDRKVMPFVAMIKRNFENEGASAFNRDISFNELQTLKENMDYLKMELSMFKVKKVEVIDVDGVDAGREFSAEEKLKIGLALPGQAVYELIDL